MNTLIWIGWTHHITVQMNPVNELSHRTIQFKVWGNHGHNMLESTVKLLCFVMLDANNPWFDSGTVAYITSDSLTEFWKQFDDWIFGYLVMNAIIEFSTFDGIDFWTLNFYTLTDRILNSWLLNLWSIILLTYSYIISKN